MRNAERNVNVTAEQQTAIALLFLAPAETLYTSTRALHLARRIAPLNLWIAIAERVRPFQPSRYQRRWARRLRQAYGFEREDAHHLALASFGEGSEPSIFCANFFVTFDLRLIERFQTFHTDIDHRLKRMTCQLLMPYRDAELPEVLTPQVVLSRFIP